jgi:FkbM family methyltransferase
MLLRGIVANRAADSLIAVSAAAGQEAGVSELRFGASMGNKLDTEHARRERYGLQVPVATVDQLLQDLNAPTDRRIIMKIDVEGFEAEVLRGAAAAIQSGRVALIIWERGEDYRRNAGVQSRAIAASRWLSELGYRHYTLPYHDWGGPLIPATDDWFYSNIFSFARGVEKRDLYPQVYAHRPPFDPTFRMQRTPERSAAVAQMCMEARTSDGIRWADPFEIERSEEAHAIAAAQFILSGAKVLDLGCGNMALARKLPAGCAYKPADLIARSDSCAVADLNQGHFPDGAYDVIALLSVLEYVHDVPALLHRCRAAAARLVLKYEPMSGSRSPLQRRANGFFNDFSAEDLEAVLSSAGFRAADRANVGASVLLNCIAD